MWDTIKKSFKKARVDVFLTGLALYYRKQIAYWASAFSRGLWLPILFVTLLPIASGSMKLSVILALIFLSHSFVSASYMSWLFLIAELVPDKIQGRFFGTRNMICGEEGMIAMVALIEISG